MYVTVQQIDILEGFLKFFRILISGMVEFKEIGQIYLNNFFAIKKMK